MLLRWVLLSSSYAVNSEEAAYLQHVHVQLDGCCASLRLDVYTVSSRVPVHPRTETAYHSPSIRLQTKCSPHRPLASHRLSSIV